MSKRMFRDERLALIVLAILLLAVILVAGLGGRNADEPQPAQHPTIPQEQLDSITADTVSKAKRVTKKEKKQPASEHKAPPRDRLNEPF